MVLRLALVLAALLTALFGIKNNGRAQEIVGERGALAVGALHTAVPDPSALPTVFRLLRKSEVGARWPLAADEAYVGCVRQMPRETVIVVVDGIAWALTSQAKRWVAKNMPEIDVSGHRAAVRAAGAREPWLADDPEFPGLQKSPAPLLDAAKRLGCLPRSG